MGNNGLYGWVFIASGASAFERHGISFFAELSFILFIVANFSMRVKCSANSHHSVGIASLLSPDELLVCYAR